VLEQPLFFRLLLLMGKREENIFRPQGKINDEGNGFTAKMEDFELIGQVVSQPLPMAKASLSDASRTVVAAANAGFADENSLVANLSAFGVINSSLDAKLADPATLVVRARWDGLFRLGDGPARKLIDAGRSMRRKHDLSLASTFWAAVKSTAEGIVRDVKGHNRAVKEAVANSEMRVADNVPAFARPLAEKAELAA